MLNLFHKHTTKSDWCFPFSILCISFSSSFLSFFSSFLQLGLGSGVGVDSEYEGGERNFLRGTILHASSPPQCNNSSLETAAEGVARRRRQLLDFLITPLSA